jgi:hypothetical protein
MATKKSTAEQFGPAKDHPERRTEELHFADYIKDKKSRKHMEELAVEDFISSKKPIETT